MEDRGVGEGMQKIEDIGDVEEKIQTTYKVEKLEKIKKTPGQTWIYT